jgi:hypothetical protein
MTGRKRWGQAGPVTLVVTVLVAAVGVLGWLVLFKDEEKPVASTVSGGVAVSQLSASDLTKVARTRVFFGHQSVGMNILDGVPAVFAAHGIQAPTVEPTRIAPDAGGGLIAHTTIGENTKPLQKIQDFETVIRDGMGKHIDVAVMKLCYIDIAPDTDVDALFAMYRSTMAALQRDYPQVTFVKATVPLTTDPGTLSKLKGKLTGGGGFGPAANAKRERLNELIRKAYAGDHLFDVAAVESTAPDGSRVSGTYQGQPYFALYDGYATDEGHLNVDGSRRAATAWLSAVAQASSK